ncbi:mitochondrial amidoxime-reducing component 1 [Equus asinus]|uniref:Mitochondrial amidoxime reducing component 1 n=4 Tax=Equus TaxID=9789 RepID=A0A3Q2HLT2_HORSE|nr:PREDICTED: mitochondrial amidoxime-reducing component 1 [Equus przewalskii]XP_023488577.1 mitochondrial amidoxime-reducing component 1 [Equus caballus]XP_044618770.1 mitochondrial amidoxime-reducing component 1 [Equus asinus]
MGAAGSSALARLGLPAPPRSRWLGVAALGLAAVALGAVAWRRARPRRRGRLQQVGTVAQLWIYPVKSCRGVPVSAAECTAMGLRSGHLRDRFWLVTSEDGNMVTARQEPRLVLISLTCEGDTLTLSAPYTKDLLLPIKTPPTNAVHKCRVHSLEIEGRDCGEEAAQWITSFLKTRPYRLVHFEPHMRPRNSHQIKDVFRPTDQIAYPDASPFLIFSEASLADLNSRLEKKVKATNFRPNIVISGCGVYAEDSWHELLIGDVELKRVMACSRCILTTVDPDTGIMDRKEPLETLKSYRLCDPSEQKLYGKSPLFGQYFVLENPGTIQVGDPVYLLDQ